MYVSYVKDYSYTTMRNTQGTVQENSGNTNPMFFWNAPIV